MSIYPWPKEQHWHKTYITSLCHRTFYNVRNLNNLIDTHGFHFNSARQMGEEISWIRGIYKREMFIRAVIMSKSGWGGGRGFPMATMSVVPGYFHRKIEKIKPKEIPSHLIPRLLVVFTQLLEILLFILTNATKLLNICSICFFANNIHSRISSPSINRHINEMSVNLTLKEMQCTLKQ